MLKSGLIFGGIALVLTAITGAINFQLCGPCLTLFLGLGAGYLAGTFDKPFGTNASAKAGAGAGAIGGAGALVGHLGGGALGSVIMGPEQAAEFARQFGLPASSDPTGYFTGAMVASCCFGLLGLGIMAGLGALGGLLWYQMTGKNVGAGAPPSPPATSM